MNTLKAAEWEIIFALPMDGRDYHVDGVAIRAKHLPQTNMRTRQVVVDSGKFGVIRRQFVRGRWQATEHIGGY